MKGSSLAFGAPRMAELCRALEDGRDDRPRLVGELRRELGRVLDELALGNPAAVAT